MHIITPQTTTMTTSTRTTTDSTLFHFLFRFPSLRRPPGRTDGQHVLLTQQFRTHTFLDGRHTFRKREDNHSEKKLKEKENRKGNQRKKPSLTRTSTQQPCQHKKKKKKTVVIRGKKKPQVYMKDSERTLLTQCFVVARTRSSHT